MASIKKMGDGSYKITVSLGYDVYGKKIRRYTTWVPDKEYTPRQLEKEVNRQATLFEEACKTGQITQGGGIKLVDFIPQWIENISVSATETTVEKYQYICDTIIIPALGHMKLKDIKPAHVQKFVNTLSKTKRADKQGQGEDGKTLAPSSVNRYYTCLRSIMHDAYRLELISSNPCDGGRIKLPTIGETVTEIYDKQELAQLLEALKDEPLQFQVLIHLAINTGCRRGELVALEWSDIDFENMKVYVHKSACKPKNKPITIKDTKTHRSHTIDIPDYLVDMLKRHQQEQLNRRLKLGTAWQGRRVAADDTRTKSIDVQTSVLASNTISNRKAPEGDWLFTQANGSIMYPTSPTMIFSKFLKRKGLPHKKFHALRHTSATMSLLIGVDIKTVGERLGHSQMKTTNRYVHALEETNRRAADKLGDLFQSLQNSDTKPVDSRA